MPDAKSGGWGGPPAIHDCDILLSTPRVASRSSWLPERASTNGTNTAFAHAGTGSLAGDSGGIRDTLCRSARTAAPAIIEMATQNGGTFMFGVIPHTTARAIALKAARPFVLTPAGVHHRGPAVHKVGGKPSPASSASMLKYPVIVAAIALACAGNWHDRRQRDVPAAIPVLAV